MVVDLPSLFLRSQFLHIPDTLLGHRSRSLATPGSLPIRRMFLVTLGVPLVTPTDPRAMYLPLLIPEVWVLTIVHMVAPIMVPLAVPTAAEASALDMRQPVVLHSGMHQPR